MNASNRFNWFRVDLSILLIVLIIIYPIIFKIFQGFDFTDTGYYLTNYDLFFTHPETITYSMILWMTNFIGAVYAYFNPFGLLGMQFSGAFTVYFTIYITYQTLKKSIPKRQLLLGLFISEIVIYIYNFPVNYNNLTALFYSLSVYFIYKGIEENQRILIFISGAIMGVNIFIRLPNALGILLLLSLICLSLSQGVSKKTVSIQLAICLSGYLCAILILVGSIYLLGHLSIFYESLRTLLIQGGSSGASHGVIGLMKKQVRQYLNLLSPTFMLMSLSILIAFCQRRLSQKLHSMYFLILLTVTVISLMTFYYSPERYHRTFIYSLNGSVLFVFLLGFLQNTSVQMQRLIFLSTGVLILVPLGSGNGILNSIYGLWLAIPLSIYLLFSFETVEVSITQSRGQETFLMGGLLDSQTFFVSKYFLIMILIVTGLNHTFLYTYRETHERFNMNYSINSPYTYGVFTTPQRGMAVESLLLQLNKWVKPGETLFAFGNLPMIHYLTKTKPFLSNSWPNLYPPLVFESKLNEKKAYRELPLVLLSKYNLRVSHWPIERRPFVEKAFYVKQFLDKYKYQKVWENEHFEFWKKPAQ